jgi:ATP-dependent Lhr-like helicase
MLSFADDNAEVNHAAAVAVASLVATGQVNSILIERINSAPVLGPQLPPPVATALTDAGFARTPRGLRLR